MWKWYKSPPSLALPLSLQSGYLHRSYLTVPHLRNLDSKFQISVSAQAAILARFHLPEFKFSHLRWNVLLFGGLHPPKPTGVVRDHVHSFSTVSLELFGHHIKFVRVSKEGNWENVTCSKAGLEGLSPSKSHLKWMLWDMRFTTPPLYWKHRNQDLLLKNTLRYEFITALVVQIRQNSRLGFTWWIFSCYLRFLKATDKAVNANFQLNIWLILSVSSCFLCFTNVNVPCVSLERKNMEIF